MSVYQLPRDRVTYNYRYFLPYAPEWGPAELCEQRLRELLEFCREARIDAVQFFVNILPGTYYMPPHSAAEQAHWAQWMKETVAPAVRGLGVSYQLNFQMLLGAGSYGLDMRDEYPWKCLVNEHGDETLGCPCPLDAAFRESMGEMLRLWAGTEPDIFWIDDDFRMHNHGRAEHGLDFYCYCPRHLAEFGAFTGRSYGRAELVAAVLQPGEPGPVRRQWLDFLGRTMTETAGWVREQVQSVSPRTRLAQMTSSPDVHAAEGRDWKSFLTALSGTHAPMVRPCCGVYTGTAVPLKANTVTYRFMGQTIAHLGQALGPEAVEYGPELENTRYTTWCKAVSHTHYVLVLSQLLGCPQITLNINDEDGSPISEEPTTGPMLRDIRPRLEALARMQLRSWKPAGAVFIGDVDSARKVRLDPGARMQDLGLVREWDDTLLPMGIPARYLSPAEAAASGAAVVLEEYTAWCPSDDEIRRILAGAAFLDGGAAAVLYRRGFGRYLGVEVGSRRSFGVLAERYENGPLPGVHACRVPHRGAKWYAVTPSGAAVVSRFIDSRNRYHPGSTVYENDLGGRVAVYASVGDLAPMGSFGSHARLRWLHGVLRWISRERFPVLVRTASHGLTLVRSQGDHALIAFANLSADAVDGVSLRLRAPRPPENVRLLDESGEWQAVRCRVRSTETPGCYELDVPGHWNTFQWLILTLTGAET